MGKCVIAATIAAAAVSAAGLFSAAQAATVSIETVYRVTSQFPDFSQANGTPLTVALDYDDTGVLSASYAIGGYEGAFDTVSMSTFYDASRVAYGQTPAYGVRVDFGIGEDDIPLNIDLKNIALLFATQPGSANPDLPLTEAELEAFFASGTTALATDYMYFNPALNKTRFYTGAFEGFSFTGADGGAGGDVLETPLPAAGLLMLGGLAAIGGAFRKPRAKRG